MMPFRGTFPYHPNQIQNEGSNGSAPQQVVLSDPCVANLNNFGSNLAHQAISSSCACNNPLASTNASHIRPQLHPFNAQFPIPSNNSDTLLSNLGGNAMPMFNRPPLLPSPCFLNVPYHPHLLQNSQVGMPFLGSFPSPHLHQSNGRFVSQNNLQNLNPSATFPVHGPFFNLPHISNHMIPSQPYGQLFAHNHLQGENQIMPMQPNLCAHMPGPQIHSPSPSQNMNQNAGFPQGQFFPQGSIGNVNQLLSIQCSQQCVDPSQVVPHNVALCSHSSLGGLNQAGVAVGSQNLTFPVQPQLEMKSNEAVKHNRQDLHTFNSTGMGQNSFIGTPFAAQLPSVQTQQNQKNMQPSGFQQSQENNAKYCRNNIRNTKWKNPQGNNFPRNNCESGKRGMIHSGFQNPQFHHTANAKGKSRSFNGKGRKGYDKGGEGKSRFADSMRNTRTEHQRSLPLNYTEQEIQQWREERKKNYPSKDNVEKKLADRQTNAEVTDRYAKTRRQQLKEILAKQAELGVEVAEIPPGYLSGLENQVGEREEEKKVWRKKGRYQNKYGKRGKHDPDRQVSKKQKLGDKGPSTKRKPTLLQKLLSADIKRDKSHLLQVFRFMVLNSFFKDWPEEPLKFPTILVKETGGEGGEVIEEKCFLQLGNDGVSEIKKNSMFVDFDDIDAPKEHNSVDYDYDNESDHLSNENAEDEDVVDGYVKKIDSIKEYTEKSEEEEGEITD